MSVPSYHLCVWRYTPIVKFPIIDSSLICACSECGRYINPSEIHEILMIIDKQYKSADVCKNCISKYPITYDYYHELHYNTSWDVTVYSMEAFISYSGGKIIPIKL